jgi:hypothetical protein
MKFSMTGQKSVLLIQVTTWTSLTVVKLNGKELVVYIRYGIYMLF